MQSLEHCFKQWMQQPGIVKQLELALTISIVIIFFLGQQLLGDKLSANQRTKETPNITKTTEAELRQVTEEELNSLIREYLDNFFSVQSESIEYLKLHTETDLYLHSIEPEIKKRIELKLISEFELNDLYLESINSTQAKAICIGQENFPQGDYQSRNLHIELIIDTSALKIVAIPVFQIN